jgi:hypothetical protein
MNISRFSEKTSSLTTYVRGKVISLTLVALTKIWNIPFEPCPKFTYPPDKAPSREELGEFLGLTSWTNSLSSFPVDSIQLPARMLAHMIMNNLFPILWRSDFTYIIEPCFCML